MNRQPRNRTKIMPNFKQQKNTQNVHNKCIKSVQQHQPKTIGHVTSKSKSKSNQIIKNSNKYPPSNKNKTVKSNPRESSEQSLKTPLKRAKLTASEDRITGREKQFKRKNNGKIDEKKSKSKKDSKRSTDNQNEETLVQRLRAQNEFYRQAYISSKENFNKLQRALKQQKSRRSHEKEWFKSQINNLKKKLSADKIKLCHIFSFQTFENQEISNMIVETENESSSVINNPVKPPMQEDFNEHLSDLSIESK